MDICGKWKLVSVDNIEGYSDAIGTSEENKVKATKLLTADNNICQEINIDGINVAIVITVPGKELKVDAVVGNETDVVFLDGRKLKSVFTIDGQILKEQQTGAFESTNLRYIEGSNLILKMTSGNATTTRTYERI